MDDFDVFGDADDAPAAPPLLPRATTHPHFDVCRTLWPTAGEPSDAHALLMEHVTEERTEATARSLKKSRSTYGKSCAKSFIAACAAFRSRENYPEHARAVIDLCATAIEESNWDTTGFSEANMIALCLTLLHTKDPADVGKRTIALFNL